MDTANILWPIGLDTWARAVFVYSCKRLKFKGIVKIEEASDQYSEKKFLSISCETVRVGKETVKENGLTYFTINLCQ